MPMLSQHVALEALCTAPLIRLEDAPRNMPGLYLLHDEAGVPRYIGQTGNLRHRVWSNHCVGDKNSHKFVAVFNAGRLWHIEKETTSDPEEGALAKSLRAQIARRFCLVRTLVLQGSTKAERIHLEGLVRAIAPGTMNDWNDKKAIPAAEPVSLVDQVLDEMGWAADERAKLDRQATRWQAWKTEACAAA